MRPERERPAVPADLGRHLLLWPLSRGRRCGYLDVVAKCGRRPRLERSRLHSGIGSTCPPALYVLLFLLVVAWQIGRRRGPKINKWIVAAPLTGVALVLAAALLDRTDSSVVFPTNRPVFVIGDSLSAGMGASKEGTWPQLVSASLHLDVSNLARAGATLADGKAQAEAIPRAQRPSSWS